MSMKLINITALLVSCFILVISSAFSTKSKERFLTNHVAISPDGQHVLFTYSNKRQTGLFRLDLKSGEVRLLINPSSDYLYSPKYSIKTKRILYLSKEEIGKVWKQVIYISDSEGNNKRKIFEYDKNIIRATFDPSDERIYFTTASEIGNSSPLVRPHPRGNMDIFSINVDGGDMREETDFNAYVIGSDLLFNKKGDWIFFHKIELYHELLSAEESSNSKVHHEGCGPYKLNIETKELKSMVPTNYQDLYLIDGNYFFPDFIYPIPDFTDEYVFLESATAVYKMDMNTMQAKLFYQQPKEEVKKKYRVMYWSPIPNSTEYLMLKQTGKNENAFFVLNNNGEVIKKIVPDMSSFLVEFKN